MKDNQKSKVVEDDACFRLNDIDPVLYGNGKMFRFQPDDASEWLCRSFPDFAGWLYETGRIGHYSDKGDGLIVSGGYEYTYPQFLRDMALSGEIDSLIRQYEQCRGGDDRWISDIRDPQPAGDLLPTGYTPDQEAAMDEYYYE